MNTNPAGYSSPGRLSLRQTAARAGNASRCRFFYTCRPHSGGFDGGPSIPSFPARRASTPWAAAVGGRAFVVGMEGKPSPFQSARTLPAQRRGRDGPCYLPCACPGLTSIVIRRASRRFPATGGASYLSVPPTFQARHHSRRNIIKSFPSHGAISPSIANEYGEGECQGVGQVIQTYRGGHG